MGISPKKITSSESSLPIRKKPPVKLAAPRHSIKVRPAPKLQASHNRTDSGKAPRRAKAPLVLEDLEDESAEGVTQGNLDWSSEASDLKAIHSKFKETNVSKTRISPHTGPLQQQHPNEDIFSEDFIFGFFKTLRLVDKKINRIDEDVKKLRNLQELSLTGNWIESVEGHNLPSRIQILHLNANKLTACPDISKLGSLLHFGASYNLIKSIDGFSALPSLISLDLSGNELCDLLGTVRALECVPNLQILALLRNPIFLVEGYRQTVVSKMKKLIVLDETNVSISERSIFPTMAVSSETILSPIANPEIKLVIKLQELTGIQQPAIQEPSDGRPPDEVVFHFEAIFDDLPTAKFVCSDSIPWVPDMMNVNAMHIVSFPVTTIVRNAFDDYLTIKMLQKRFTFVPANESLSVNAEAGTRPGSSIGKAASRPVTGSKKEPPAARPASPKKDVGKKAVPDKGKKGAPGKGKKEDETQYEKQQVDEIELGKTRVHLKAFLEGQKAINGDYHLERVVDGGPVPLLVGTLRAVVKLHPSVEEHAAASSQPPPLFRLSRHAIVSILTKPLFSAVYVSRTHMSSQIQTRRAAAAMAAKHDVDQENAHHAAPHAKLSLKEPAVKGLAAAVLGLKHQANGAPTVHAVGKPAPGKVLAAKKQPLGAVHQVQHANAATTKVVKPSRTRSQSAKKTATETAKTTAKTSAAHAEVAKMARVPKPEDHEAKPAVRRAVKPATRAAAPVVAAAPAAVSGPKTRAAAHREQSSETGVENAPAPNRASQVAPVVESQIAMAAPALDHDDLDADDACDPMMLSEYVVEIFEYMKKLEVNAMPNPTYMDSQKELKWNMRDILVDWLIDIHNKFRLLPETLYLAVNIIDRFLSLRVVSLVKLQLVGITSMFIASKYEEVIAPSIKNFIYMADNGYTEEEIQKAERYVLSVLDFNLQYPSSMSFLRRCSKAENYNIQTRTLAKYLMEISLVDHGFLDVLPSHVAASGLYLARRMLDQGPWDANLAHYSGYSEAAIEPVSDMMIEYLRKPCKHEAFFKKYASKKFMKASIFVKEWMIKQYDL
ncbi:G2/mitotic-specific cyclin [Podochytrium sp. JEL0797]|nr:G2/mitotic-specific cyclin [Podochytrium sp. JEL0797]